MKDRFIVQKENVIFEFSSTIVPLQRGSVSELVITGTIPTPKLIKGDRLILPIDEGIVIDVAEEYVFGLNDANNFGSDFDARGGTMSLFLVERNGKFLLCALDSGLHARYEVKKKAGLYAIEASCDHPCKVIYSIFNSLPEACRYYRSTKQNLVTLQDKIKNNQNIEKIMGGIFWIWNDNYDTVMYATEECNESPDVGENLLHIADTMYKDGVRNALIGIFFENDSKYVKPLYEKYGYLCTQYDNYNDVLNKDMLSFIPNNRVKNCDYTYRRMKDYPQGVKIAKDGTMCPAWALKGFNGKMYEQNTLCPVVAKERMLEEVKIVLEKYPYYKGRFIDVFGGDIGECYSKVHPMTREECLDIKQEAFSKLREMGLVIGTEDGFEDIINSLDYTEGLHSPVEYRVEDAGRNHAHVFNEEQIAFLKTNMVNPVRRVPLWQLVYHDCLLSFPYWGDSTECSPGITKKKILFACLYGCPPLYSFMLKDFNTLKSDILESYQHINKVVSKVAVLPMSDYRVLTDDYMVQRTVFGDRYQVTVNFDEVDRMIDEIRIKANAVDFVEL